MSTLTLSVVSHGHGEMLARLLEDLTRLTSIANARVVVTLNLADEPFDSSRFPSLDLCVVRNKLPQGFGANHNAAFQRCQTPWFAVLNPDLRLPEDPFHALYAASQRWPDAAALAPRVLNPERRVEDSVRDNLTPASLIVRRILRRREASAVQRPARRGQPFYWLAGMFLLLRADAFRAVGGFDPRFFMYCEDYDLCARLYNAGYAIVLEPSARVVHDARRDSHRSWRHLRWHVSSLLKVWCSRTFWKLTFEQRPVASAGGLGGGD